MEKSLVLKKFFSKKTQDYTYVIAFFFIFSFFVFYIIRPNLITVVQISTKIDQLKKINTLYTEQIDKVVEIQSELEGSRDDFLLLKEAIAAKPEVNKVLFDINVSSEEANLSSERISLSDVNLKEKGATNKLKFFIVSMNLVGTFDDLMSYIKEIFSQRRLKLISEMDIAKEKLSSKSATLKIKLEVEGFYL